MTKSQSVSRLLWLGACAMVLIWWVIIYGLDAGSPDALKSEAMIYVVIAMAALSFPAGLVWTVIVAIAARLLHGVGVDTQASIWVGLLFYWASTVALGYVQWFIVVPRIKARREARSQQSAR